MKTMKKLASVALALILTLALAAPAFAAEVTINVPGQELEETYTAYKILDAQPLEETSSTNEETGEIISTFKSVVYTISMTSPFYETISKFPGFVVEEKEEGVASVTLAEGATFDAAVLAAELKKVIDNEETEGLEPIVFNDNKGNLENGYFLITSSLGSKMIVDTFGKENMTINTKNDLPKLKGKTIESIENGTVADDNKSGTAAYGSTVTFNIAVEIPATAVGEIVVHDEMDNNLTYVDGSLTGATLTETTETAKEGFTHKDFTIPVTEANKGTTVTIAYTATLNNDAPVDTALKNTAHLTYSSYETPDDEVQVYTYEFDLVKTDADGVVIDGAKFDLYKIVEVEEEVEENGETVKKTVEKKVSVQTGIEAGTVTIKGLSAGKYELEETQAPQGYNKLKAPQAFEIEDASLKAKTTETATNEEGETVNIPLTYVEGGVQVVNKTGFEFPSTGGIGTTIFYIVGGILVVGAGILLVTKKRVGEED